MRKIFLLLICLLFTIGITAQSFIGAWEGFSESKEGLRIRTVISFADGYHVMSKFEADSGKFITTNGGAWKFTGDTMTQIIEFIFSLTIVISVSEIKTLKLISDPT